MMTCDVYPLRIRITTTTLGDAVGVENENGDMQLMMPSRSTRDPPDWIIYICLDSL